MKATYRIEKSDKDGLHNDRNFDINKAEHIDAERMYLNKYWTLYDTELSFKDMELEFYTRNFSKHIEFQNEKHLQCRRKDKMVSVEEYYKAKNTRPEDVILQVGNRNEHITGEELWKCAMQYRTEFDEKYGKHCKILNMALHMDEATPHVHIRRVWLGEDKYGHQHASCNSALQKMGFDMSDEKSTWKNNPKTKFTEMERGLFENICQRNGIDIDIDNRSDREHLSLDEYKKKMRLKDLEKTREDLEEQAERKALALLESERRMMEENIRSQLERENDEIIRKAIKKKNAELAKSLMEYIQTYNQYDFMQNEIKMDKIMEIKNLTELWEEVQSIQQCFFEKTEKNFQKMEKMLLQEYHTKMNELERKEQITKDILEDLNVFEDFQEEFEQRISYWESRGEMLM